MFFLAFASSIRIFTLFLNLGNSEIFLIPAIILLAALVSFWHWMKWSGKGKGNLRGKNCGWVIGINPIMNSVYLCRKG